MIHSIRATHGMVVAPHALAAQSGLAVLRDGGNAIEAMVAAAAAISIAYPHMNGIGGDAFWLILPPDGEPIAIEAAGPAAANATGEAYRTAGLATIPTRGPLAMNTVAGAVGSWDAALKISQQHGGHLPLSRLLRDACQYANEGIAVTSSQVASTVAKFDQVAHQPGFAQRFLIDGKLPKTGALFIQPTLGGFMEQMAAEGLDSFYRGALAENIAADFKSVGALLSLRDLNDFRPRVCSPLGLTATDGTLYNMVPPTQGVISLAILGILERAGIKNVGVDSADFIHLCVEATKQAFILRDEFVTDPAYMAIDPQQLLDADRLDALAAQINIAKALPWARALEAGDTVWMGAVDSTGFAVSFIQSIYHEFGSGVVLPTTGLNWQNRGASFSLNPKHLQALQPRKKPFHTLNPAAANFTDGRRMVYGTMGGDGQPQTQTAIYSRAIWFGQELQQAISAPRWLLGRTWGQSSDTLKLERRIPDAVLVELKRRGHDIEMLGAYDEVVGHAGAIISHSNGVLEGGSDPRADGCVAGF